LAAVKRHNRDWSGLKLWRRFAFGFCGLAIAATGVVALAAGRVYFQTTDFFIAFAPPQLSEHSSSYSRFVSVPATDRRAAAFLLYLLDLLNLHHLLNFVPDREY